MSENLTQAEFPSLDAAAVSRAIRDGIFDAMPVSDDLAQAVRDGVAAAMPYPSQILDAISAGVEVAVREHLDSHGLSVAKQ